MFTNAPKHTYTITLPATTSKEVVEWFEIMENSNQLSEALVELIHSGIKSGKYQNAASYDTTLPGEQPKAENGQPVIQDNFMDSLYNWQDSTNAIFKEVKEEKKEKKRMLSV
jgi:hypothetical protein